MTKRRTFLKSAATGLAAISSPSVFAGSFTQNISDANKNSVNDVLRFISIKDMEFIKLKFDKKTPLNWNAVVKSGGTYPGASFLKITCLLAAWAIWQRRAIAHPAYLTICALKRARLAGRNVANQTLVFWIARLGTSTLRSRGATTDTAGVHAGPLEADSWQ